MSQTNDAAPKSTMDKVLDWVERTGNRLPDPITLFLYLAVAVVVLSGICSLLDVQAVNPANGKTIKVFNLFSAAGIKYLFSNVVKNFSGFAPMGMVLVAVLGAAVAEKSGFLIALMQRFLGKAKGWIVTGAIIMVGINMNVAGDAGFIILPPLCAILYISLGRSPLLGLYVSYAAVAAGLCAKLFLGLSDALAYGFTEPAAKMIDPNYQQSIAINWYFLFASCILLTVAGTFLVENFLLKRFNVTEEELQQYDYDGGAAHISAEQKSALNKALLGFAAFIALITVLSVTGILADDKGSITSGASPFSKGIVFTASIALLIPGAIYGFATGKYQNDKDLWADISKGMAEMGNYIFMCFFISIFTNFFGVSQLGTILAINGAEGLKAVGFTGIPLLLGLLILSSFVNIFIGSASAKWAILAPVYVPMMMLMGYDPAITQVVYRIGDSLTNPLSPLFYYTPVILGYAHKYKEDVGMGTIISNMLPFSACFTVVWVIQLIVWVLLDLPLGPGGGIFLK